MFCACERRNVGISPAIPGSRDGSQNPIVAIPHRRLSDMFNNLCVLTRSFLVIPRTSFVAGSKEYVSKHMHVTCRHSYDCVGQVIQLLKTLVRVYIANPVFANDTREYDQPTQ